jgi:hypothetical protein
MAEDYVCDIPRFPPLAALSKGTNLAHLAPIVGYRGGFIEAGSHSSGAFRDASRCRCCKRH